MLLQGRHALITGASSGIGRATAIRLANEGCSVAVNYFSDHEQADAQAVVAEAEKAGVTALAVKGDVGAEADVVAMVQTVVAGLGGLDLMVNNAGIEKEFSITEMPLSVWEAVLRTNLTGTFLCTREAARHMTTAGVTGVIVNMSSVHEFIAWPGFSHYCASKGGMKLFAQTVAKELAPKGIRVVNVAPGAIATPINAGLMGDAAQLARVVGEVPLGRIGQPEEIAAAVAWVASDQAAYITGTTLVVDGGMSAYPNFI